VRQQLEASVQLAVEALLSEYGLDCNIRVALERPKFREHGDYAVNIAMPLAGRLKIKPREVARRLIELTDWPPAVESTDIAGPGFINIYLQEASEAKVLYRIIEQGSAYGCVSAGEGPRAIVEYVSANPTGPMHVGHGRGAVVGDVIASVLQARGVQVHREYYINDAGVQIAVIAHSLWIRARQLSGEDARLDETDYPGEYLLDIARELLVERKMDRLTEMEEQERNRWLADFAIARIMDIIREDLAALGIRFDRFYSERTLHESGMVRRLIDQLKEDGLVYRGTLPPPKGKEINNYEPVEQWLFRTTAYGDDVDRPLAKQDGAPTYFAADIAYHKDKHDRGFGRMIDVWGADHGGYVRRVQAAVHALTGKSNQPEVVLVQMVNLTRAGKPVRMSKRAGTFVTLREVVDEVGRDAVRFNFLTRRAQSQLDFDLETAKQQSEDNPVYYVQYAHARVCAILRKAKSTGVDIVDSNKANVELLIVEDEQKLVAQLLAYPNVLEQAAIRLEPYRIATFLMRLAASLHAYYHKHRVIGVANDLCLARLLLIRAIGQVLYDGLGILGVSAPDHM